MLSAGGGAISSWVRTSVAEEDVELIFDLSDLRARDVDLVLRFCSEHFPTPDVPTTLGSAVDDVPALHTAPWQRGAWMREIQRLSAQQLLTGKIQEATVEIVVKPHGMHRVDHLMKILSRQARQTAIGDETRERASIPRVMLPERL
jgi:hypothetical protein